MEEEEKTTEFTVPKDMAVESVIVCAGVANLKYSLQKAIDEGRVRPVNVSRGRYETVTSGPVQAIKVVLVATK